MTIIIGVRCSNGVVVGADSMATSSMGPHRLIQILSDDKIYIVDNKIIVASTGSVGLAQRFHDVVRKSWDKKKFQGKCLDCVKEIAKETVNDFTTTGVPRTNNAGLGFGSLMALPMEGVGNLVEFATTDFQPEIKKGRLRFVTMGSGQLLADPFLAFVSRVLWGDAEPDVKAATLGVHWVLDHTLKYAPGGVGPPIKLATLRREKSEWVARSLEGQELSESGQHVAEIEKRIGSYSQSVADNIEPPAAPSPPSPAQ